MQVVVSSGVRLLALHLLLLELVEVMMMHLRLLPVTALNAVNVAAADAAWTRGAIDCLKHRLQAKDVAEIAPLRCAADRLFLLMRIQRIRLRQTVHECRGRRRRCILLMLPTGASANVAAPCCLCASVCKVRRQVRRRRA